MKKEQVLRASSDAGRVHKWCNCLEECKCYSFFLSVSDIEVCLCARLVNVELVDRSKLSTMKSDEKK